MENKKQSYQTLREAVDSLRERGFDSDLDLIDSDHVEIGGIKCSSDQISIVEHHRFEGMTNPADSSIMYAIKCNDDDAKGLLIDSYGAKSSDLIDSFIKKVSYEK